MLSVVVQDLLAAVLTSSRLTKIYSQSKEMMQSSQVSAQLQPQWVKRTGPFRDYTLNTLLFNTKSTLELKSNSQKAFSY